MATLKDLQTKIELIEENHLKHMKEDIDRIERKVDKMDVRLWAILLVLISIVIGAAIKDVF